MPRSKKRVRRTGSTWSSSRLLPCCSWRASSPITISAHGLAGLVAACGGAAITAQGRMVREYLAESQFELRKVVWPTREETLRTTLVIIVVVIILSALLGVIDVMLKWVVLD